MAQPWREVRVFISSTFKDMQAERDHLVRFVFPRLREELLKRRIHFVDVDLRWGVTADQDAFDLCMREIKRCRPRFLCILGGRYGWIPAPKTVERNFMDRILAGQSSAEQLTAEMRSTLTELYCDGEEHYRLSERPREDVEIETWERKGAAAVRILQRAGLPEAERSITSSEVYYGALDRLDRATFRYFYFREDDATNSVPEAHASAYVEEPGGFAENELRKVKSRVSEAEGLVLKAPGEEVRARVPVFEYPCRWDPNTARFVGMEKFGERVYRDLLDSVNAEFGTAQPEQLDLYAEENAALEMFIETRIERYVVGSRRPVLDALREHAEGSGGNGYLCVVGDPGSGKSALLAKFHRDYVLGTDDVPPHDTDLVVPHFVGVNASNVRDVLGRLCHELAEGAGLTDEIPADYDSLRKAFPEFLEKAAAVKHVLVLLDAVNQLDSTHGAHFMTWLPDNLPDDVRIVLTTLPGPVLESLRRRREPPTEVQLEPLSESDATAIIGGFLERYRKEMDDEQRSLLLGKREVGSPLYLLTALEELRTLGTYEQITTFIRQMPDEVRPLFNWILDRLEHDPGFRNEAGRLVGERLVADYCSYLSLGRSGMAQSELADLVAPADADKGTAADPQGNVAALRALLLPYLMRRGELLDFFHGQIREAVQERYLQEEEKQPVAHRAIADYFARKTDPESDGSYSGDSLRGLSELPYHLTECNEWQKVHDTLTNFRFLERKAAEVGVVERKDEEGNVTKTYTGVLQLQDDYDRALEKMPGEHATGARRRIIVTPVDFGDGYVIRCPFCNKLTPFDEGWLGQEIKCPQEGCGGPLKVNPFVCKRPSFAD
jgi:telomerase protein component 1